MCSPKELQPGTVFKFHFKRQCRGRKGNVMYIYIIFIYIVWKSTTCSIFKIYTKYELNWYFKNGFEFWMILNDIANTMTLSTYMSFFKHVIWPHGGCPALPGPAMAEPQVPEASQVPQTWQGDVARRQEMPRHEGGGPRGGWSVSHDASVNGLV